MKAQALNLTIGGFYWIRQGFPPYVAGLELRVYAFLSLDFNLQRAKCAVIGVTVYPVH